MNDSRSKVGTTRRVPVEQLRLDPHSHRLIGVATASTDEWIIALLYRTVELDELLQSISTNGYLDIEPLVAVAAPDGDGLVVLEGNRRLAALRLLREPDLVRRIASSEKLTIMVPEVEDAVRPTLDRVTVYQVANREEARPFIGFKHIQGPAKWDAYTKARFVADWYRDAGVGIEDIANALGDRHGTIRRMVATICVLEQASRNGIFDIEDRYTPKFNFSHLFAALSRCEYQDYLGLDPDWARGEPRCDPVPDGKLDELRNVLLWIYGSRQHAIAPVVRTMNPEIRRLGEVLAHAEGRHVLAVTRDLRQAHAVTEPIDRRFVAALLRARNAIGDAAGSLRTYDGRDESLLDITEDVRETSDAVYRNMLKKRRRAAART